MFPSAYLVAGVILLACPVWFPGQVTAAIILLAAGVINYLMEASQAAAVLAAVERREKDGSGPDS